ncbi:MAG: hypothetical protein AB1798_23460, partial [Spirochaetota bacterium]
MRILTVSNFYPPYYRSWYELGCHSAMEGLKALGHEIKVLTSTYRVESPQIDGEIYRWLQPCFQRKPGTKAIFHVETVNQIAFKQVCREFQPDVVFFWSLTHISISLAFL